MSASWPPVNTGGSSFFTKNQQLMETALDDKQRRAQAVLRAKAREFAERKRIDDKCRTDGLWWAQNMTRTYDEQSIKRGNGGGVYKPFPKHDYFELVWHGSFRGAKVTDACLLRSVRLMIPKSREMMTSWIVCAYAMWHCLYFERTRVIMQTQKEDKAIELVEYCRTMYTNMSDWMRELHPVASRLDKQPANKLILANQSRIQGVPAGADQIRSFHPTIYVMDEAAKLPEAQACYDFANPVCPQIIGVSSAAPGWFGDICSR